MQFRDEYPEFEKVDDNTINHFLESSELVVSKKVWGKLYELGLFAYTAHRLAVYQLVTHLKTHHQAILATTI